MLAVPRPLQLERILPVVASLGVDTLVLCQAKKVGYAVEVRSSMECCPCIGRLYFGFTVVDLPAKWRYTFRLPPDCGEHVWQAASLLQCMPSFCTTTALADKTSHRHV